ncbi:MAG: 2Fe-2S iron-sulfur cluster-binding protein [Gloeomargarita sp. SKYBB_i_bin120]|nr:2Fe-2S iron-sulfur cluster-binding protein [Gloeomargarita sp. SKYG98]MCS7292430.1 2Fe-2S iron-sulfur cluster-binding protein [Gloeomargarita sp. SKYB120]MDW8177991.1 2Fe-2S iron-sulfur cluster-binding protein [Gloeomargarita sp. SKYBB_i_bin120]
MTEIFPIEIRHRGQVFTIQAPANQTILDSAAAAGWELPSSCRAGICTTCAARLLSGTVEQPDAMGLSPALMEQGFALLCVAYPRSPIVLETGHEETVYELQFGQFQKPAKS